MMVISTLLAYSQAANVDGNKETLKAAVQIGVFEITMPDSVSEKDVEKSKSYYTDYFTVSYNSENRLATIEMIENTAKSRRVITRLLLSIGVKEVNIDNKDYTLNDFYTIFLQ